MASRRRSAVPSPDDSIGSTTTSTAFAPGTVPVAPATAVGTTPPGAPTPVPALASGDGLALSGASGYLWPGAPLTLTAAQGAIITVPLRAGPTEGNDLFVHVQAPAPPGLSQEFDMSFEFKAPVSHVLMVGTYTNATRAPFAQVGAGIDISGMGRGCNMERGDFTVRSVSIGPSGWFNAFDVTFSDICDGQAPLSGEVRYTRPTPGPNDGPQGTSIDATLPAPSAASAHMQGSTVIVTWTPPAGNNAWELFRTDGTASFATAVQVLAAGGPGQAGDDMAVPGRTYTYFVATPAGGNHVSRPAQVTFTVRG